MEFVAIDVETANADLASICQIGVASVQSGRIVDQWSSLVDPEDFFDPVNIAIHGIDEDRIRGAPTFARIYSEFQTRTSGPVIVSHTGFDRAAIAMAVEKYDLPQGAQVWLDSARVARRAWPDKYAARGYGLANVAADLGISFKHHDAAEDARAAAEILLRACEVAALDLDGWMERVRRPISPESSAPIRRRKPRGGTLWRMLVLYRCSCNPEA